MSGELDLRGGLATDIATRTPAKREIWVNDDDHSLHVGDGTTVGGWKLATKVYVDAIIATADALVFKGVIDCSANPNYPAADNGHTYKVSVAGKIGGASGTPVEVGDLLLCTVDGSASGTQAAVGANWTILQANIDGAVTGPASSVAGHVPTFTNTSGKIIQDSGVALSALARSGANSDITYLVGPGGVVYFGGNTTTIPTFYTATGGFAALAVSWNHSVGLGEVNFWNTYPGGYKFSKVTAAGTYTDLATLDGSGNLALLAGLTTTTVTGLTTALDPAYGGTGQLGGYAVGDILYASGAATLAKLADVAAGSVLLSGGVATAPAWGKITTSMFAANVVDNDGTLAANSSTRLPTQAAVKAYADQLIAAADAMVYKGAIDCSANPNYPAADRGWTYKVSVAGKIGGASGINVEVGDTLLCLTDGTASGNQATVGANWNIVQANLDGAVIGPASATNGNPAVFSGSTGKVITELSYATFKGALALVKGDVGLGSVDNTSDATKNAAAVTLTNKTLDNTNVITVKTNNYTIQDSTDTTKQAKWSLSGLTTATTRTYTWPDVSDTVVLLGATQALTNKTINGNTITSSSGTITMAAAKTLGVSNTLTFAGTDGSTLNVGGGGTMPTGSAAYKATGTSGNTVPLLDGTNTWTNKQTITGGVGLNGSATTTVGIDASGQSSFTVANGGNQAVAFCNFGLLAITETSNTGNTALFLLGAATIAVLVSTDANWVASNAPAAGKSGVWWTGSAWAVFNNEGGSRTYKALVIGLH